MKSILTAILLTVVVIPHAHAIVIRHDVDDAKYQELGEKYSSSVAFIDGCVATLIDPNWLLTASHCIHHEGRSIIAARHLDAIYRIENIFLHPNRNDIALIQLKDPILNGKPAMLYNQVDEVEKNVVFVGNGIFGNGREGLTQEYGKLRGATNTVIEATENSVVFLFNEPETATEVEGISGPGDSGGPAFVEMNKQLYVIGVSAYQRRNGFKEGHYGVKEYYTRVSSHYSWLRATIDNAQPPEPVPTHPIIASIINNETPESINASIKNILHDESIIAEAFFQSIALNRIDHAKTLIRQGADFRGITINGMSLFDFSLISNRKDMFLMLQEAAADHDSIYHPSSAVLSHFILAFRNEPNLLEGVELLIKQGANIDAQTVLGDTALITATWRTDNLDLVKLLVSHGANVNIPNSDGNTPAMDAAYLGKVNILRYLLNNGADLALKNRRGETALDLARNKSNEKAIALLIVKENVDQ